MGAIAGRTPEERPVIAGATLWQWHATYGFPLELSIPLLWDRGCRPDWYGLIATAEADGMNQARIVARLEQIVGELGLSPADRATCRAKLARYPRG